MRSGVNEEARIGRDRTKKSDPVLHARLRLNRQSRGRRQSRDRTRERNRVRDLFPLGGGGGEEEEH